MSLLRWVFLRGVPWSILALVAGSPFFLITPADDFREVSALGGTETSGARSIINKLRPSQFPLHKTSNVSVRAVELEVILRSLATYLPSGKYAVSLTDKTVTLGLAAGLPLPNNPIGRYVSGAVSIKQSDQGLNIGSLTLGRLSIPAGWLVPALEVGINWYAGARQGTLLVESIKSVSVTQDRVDLVYHPTIDVVDFARTAAADLIQVATAEQVQPYLDSLHSQARAQAAERLSFVGFLQDVFSLAVSRSASGDPVAENRAAVLALAIYFGDQRFSQFIQNTDILILPSTSEFNIGSVQLSGRHDFVQHFTTSAGMELVGGTRASRFVSELKEVLDSRGGSGFSFTDMAANRAGQKLAAFATASEIKARLIQKRLASTSVETSFFPDVSGLAEGLSDAEFETGFGGLGGDGYQSAVRDIEERVGRLAIYQD